jgi:hypothetical protein
MGPLPRLPSALSLSKGPCILSLSKDLSLSKGPCILSLSKDLSLSKGPCILSLSKDLSLSKGRRGRRKELRQAQPERTSRRPA